MKKLLSLRENSFGVDSACDQIIFTWAQCVIKSFLRWLSQHLQKFSYLLKKSLTKTIFDHKESKFQKTNKVPNENVQKICENLRTKNGSAYAQWTRKFSKIETLTKIERKKSKIAHACVPLRGGRLGIRLSQHWLSNRTFNCLLHLSKLYQLTGCFADTVVLCYCILHVDSKWIS
jgi:hypothetical protein